LPESLVKFAGDGDRIVKDVRDEDLPDDVVVRNGAGTAAK
jgi:hypothetical protein